ncbi:MAG: AAA family ATPase [Burkholderiales bacterium]|jgi:AAA15 family ATPase/GTPase
MLTTLHIKNFKAWRETGTIRLAPLTVIFGANSAGKSSLGHLLLALKQTDLPPSGVPIKRKEVQVEG